jgi:hypothetical protein
MAGDDGLFSGALVDDTQFWITPGPEPPAVLKIPKAVSTTVIWDGALTAPRNLTLSCTSPNGVSEGRIPLICPEETKFRYARRVVDPCDTLTSTPLKLWGSG